jgi:signal transduction histidine kinase
VQRRLSGINASLERRRSGETPEMIVASGRGEGRKIAEEVRGIIQAMQAEEAALLEQREAKVAEANRISHILGALAMLGLFGLGIYTVVTAYRQVRRIEGANLALTESNSELHAQIQLRQRVESQLHQSQKMEAIGQLTGGVAHDFNNMLAVIIGSLNLLARKAARGETNLTQFIDAALDGARRAGLLTQQLLAFARRQPLAPEPLEPNKLVSGLSEMLRRTLGENIGFETVIAGGIWPIKADRGQLEAALLNLAVNARDAMAGGGTLTIETANAYLDETYALNHPEVAAGQYVMISVTDTGTGMTPEIVAKAFDPFFTTKPTGAGTGLGLSQVYGFVKQSLGHIKIYTEVGKGTSIKVYLPRYVGDVPVASPEATQQRRVNAKPGESILVVEDDERVRQTLVESLRELGYHVVHATDAGAAVARLEEGGEFTLLFTDIIMPGRTGKQLADEVKVRWPAIKVLYTTGYSRNAIVHNGVLDAGVQVITKPYTIEQLAAKLREVLDA